MNIQFASIVIFSFYITLCQAAIPGVVDCSTPELVKAGKIVVHGIIKGIPVPFPLPDNDLCHFLKSGCNAQPNEEAEMDYTLYVKEAYPSIQVEIKWELVDELGVDLLCIKFPAKLQSMARNFKPAIELSRLQIFKNYIFEKLQDLNARLYQLCLSIFDN